MVLGFRAFAEGGMEERRGLVVQGSGFSGLEGSSM